MASSRKSKKSLKSSKRIAVALSGGLDSVVLLDSVCKSNDPAQAEIWVFHIHHGLQKPADQWLEFCERLAKKYRVHFDFRLLHLAGDKGNIEARARAGRYEALSDLCEEHGIAELLLAHHQNDQSETVLLQLLRGSGIAGLSGMPMQRALIGSASSGGTALLRPLLDQSRLQLEIYAKKHRLKWIEDPSNADMRFRRNAIRQQILPRLIKMEPEAVANLARSAALMSEAQGLLDRLAQQDGKGIFQQRALALAPLKILAKTDLPAANNLLRYWLKSNTLAMPSQERLQSWWQDLDTVTPNAHLEWQHDGARIRLWRGILQIAQEGAMQWEFQAIPTGSKAPGIPRKWLEEAQERGLLELRERQGAEKLQVKANTPRRTLKNLFQEHKVPPWERQAPLLYIDGNLVAVAGVGVSYPHLTETGPRVWPQWSSKGECAAQNPVK